MQKFPEKDWEILTTLKGVALERLCRRIIDQASAITCKPDHDNHHELYLKLSAHIQHANKMVADGFDDMRRSNAVLKLIYWRVEKLISDEEFLAFSRETRDGINQILR